MNRVTVAAACAAGSGLIFGACSGIKRSDLSSRSGGFESISSVSDDAAMILHYASLAPSGHNAQPWRVKVLDENTWIIGVEPQRRLSAVDPENRETLLSIGIFAENLSLAAGTRGYEATIEVIADIPASEDVLKVSLRKAKPIEYPLSRLVSRRKVKNGYRPTELTGDDVAFLSEPLEDRLFYFPRGVEHAQCIAEGTAEAFRAQSYRDDAQAELARWIRFSNKEAKLHRDGLTPACLEIGGVAGWYVRNFMHTDDVMKAGFRERGATDTAKVAQEGAGWIVITSKGSGVADLIETGRRFERMWLLARERNIAIHPMTQMLEEKPWRDEIASQHSPDMIPQFILRVGYLDTYPDPVSLRRPVSWFLRR